MTLWQELLDEIELRLGQFGMTVAATGDQEAPYYDRELIERYLYEVSVQILLEVPPEEAESLGPKAISTVTVADQTTRALNVINCLGARIDNQPAKELSPAHYYQLNTPMSSLGPKAYSFIGDDIRHSGSGANGVFTFLIEPLLSDFQGDLVSVPAKYDEERIARTLRILSAMDHTQGIVY